MSMPGGAFYDPSSAYYDAKLDVSSSSFEPLDSKHDPNREFDYVRGEPVPFENSNDAPTSIFESLIRLAERLENNQDVAPSISNIDNNIEALSASRAQIGTYLNTIETQLDINDSFKLEFKETLSDLKDLDMAEAIMEFQTKMMALQLAQQAFQQIKEMSMASKNIF